MKTKIKTYFLELIRFVLAFLFILAAIEKLTNPFAFALSIDAYQIFPEWVTNISTFFIPWLELFIGFGLLFKFKLKANLYLYLFLMIAFTLLVLVALLKGLDIECGCYGESSTKIGLVKLFENILIVVFVLLLILIKKQPQEV